MNATDPFGNEQRPDYVLKYKMAFAELGIEMEELDLRNYFNAKADLQSALSNYGLMWAAGGNTFALRWAMNKSGLDTLLPNLLQTSDLVYGGFSAGACVLSPTLKGIHLADEPEKIPATELQWEGLGLIDFCIAPHYRSNHPESPAMENVVAYYKTHNIKYKTLHDGEAIRINQGKTELVGHPTP